MVVILDYGMGNPGSILNMVRRIGGDALISSKPEDIKIASAIILPGVGSFDNGITKLHQSRMVQELEKRVIHDKVPFLGICLGMQLIMSGSEEGELPGLGWIDGYARKFNFKNVDEDQSTLRLKVPHMGWNNVSFENNLLFNLVKPSAQFYFVHSYFIEYNPIFDIASVTYGNKFSAAIQKDNFYGVQFHPEKSGKAGEQILKNFSNLSL